MRCTLCGLWALGCKIMQGTVLLPARPLRVKLMWSSNTNSSTSTSTSSGNPSTTAGTGNPSLMAAAGPKWAQKTLTLPPHRRGCHLITPKVIIFSKPNLQSRNHLLGFILKSPTFCFYVHNFPLLLTLPYIPSHLHIQFHFCFLNFDCPIFPNNTRQCYDL